MNRITSLLTAILAVILIAAPAPAQSKYKKTYKSDMQAFVDEIDASYPFLKLKGIENEWKQTKAALLKAAKKCKKDAAFVQLAFDGVACLRDAHMYVTEIKVDLDKPDPTYYSGISLMRGTDERVVVMTVPREMGASMKVGQIVLTIDGKDAREVLERRAQDTWAKGGNFSSLQRARFFEYRFALQGERNEKHVLVCLNGKKKKKVKVSLRAEFDGWPHNYNYPEGLIQDGKSFYACMLPSGFGYMYLRRVDSSIPAGMRNALAQHSDAAGWIVDLRGNTGGGYNSELLDQVKAMQGKVAVIIDAGCISAGETLARDFVNLKQARLFGTTSAGSSSSKKMWAFPSGIAQVRITTRGRKGMDGQLIEFNGITPHEITEAVPEEVAAGSNSSILRAEEYLRGE